MLPRAAFNFLTTVRGRRQSPPVISTARQFRAGFARRIERARAAEPAPECDVISRRRRRSSSPRLYGNARRPERGACSPDRNVVGELPEGDNACATRRLDFAVVRTQKRGRERCILVTCLALSTSIRHRQISILLVRKYEENRRSNMPWLSNV